MPDIKCRKCGNVIVRAGGGWVHQDKTKTYDHPPRPPENSPRRRGK